VYCELEEEHVIGDESRTVMDNWFRAPRRIRDIDDALRERGFIMPEYSPRYHDIDVAPMADPFAKWYAERHGHEPAREAAEALAVEWLEGMLPVPSTWSPRIGLSTSASSSVTGSMIRSPTRSGPCSPSGSAGTASRPASPLP
jgi:hypothetical protein